MNEKTQPSATPITDAAIAAHATENDGPISGTFANEMTATARKLETDLAEARAEIFVMSGNLADARTDIAARQVEIEQTTASAIRTSADRAALIAALEAIALDDYSTALTSRAAQKRDIARKALARIGAA